MHSAHSDTEREMTREKRKEKESKKRKESDRDERTDDVMRFKFWEFHMKCEKTMANVHSSNSNHVSVLLSIAVNHFSESNKSQSSNWIRTPADERYLKWTEFDKIKYFVKLDDNSEWIDIYPKVWY